MSPVLLSAHTISKKFVHNDYEINVLKNLTLEFNNSYTYALVGPSGSGKSTLIHILAGIETVNSGSVLFNTNNIATFTPSQKEAFLNKSIGIMFQKPYLINQLSPLENIMLSGLVIGKSYKECTSYAQELLEYIGLSEKKDVAVGSLSGGQQQRIALARALFNKPVFLLADEPTGNLDTQTAQKIITLLKKCHTDFNMGIIISTHDTHIAHHMDTVYSLKNGVVA